MTRNLPLFILPFLLFSCQSSDNSKIEPVLTTNDSIAIVEEILDSLESEMYTQWFMDTIGGLFTCYDSPDFNPELRIWINNSGDILIKDSLNPSNISNFVVDFYSKYLNKNAPSYIYPSYTRISKNQVKYKISLLEKELVEIKNTPNSDIDIIVYKQRIIDEWKVKLNLFSTLSIDTLPEPQYTAGIEYKYPDNCNIYNQILDSILLGFYKMREIDSRMYYKESYAKIFWKAYRQNDSLAIERLKPFKTLHPIQILDYGKSRYIPYTPPPPPPIEPYH